MGPGSHKAEIQLGNNSGSITDLYGVAFEIGFDPSVIPSGNAYINYTSSFFNAGNTNVQFRKYDFAAGRIHAITVRTDKNNVSGNGVIGEFWFKVRDDLADASQVDVTLTATRKINASAVESQLTSAGTSLVYYFDGVGIDNWGTLATRIYPVPADLNIIISAAEPVTASFYDLVGNLLIRKEAATQLDISQFADGSYLLLLEGEHIRKFHKVIKE